MACTDIRRGFPRQMEVAALATIGMAGICISVSGSQVQGHIGCNSSRDHRLADQDPNAVRAIVEAGSGPEVGPLIRSKELVLP